LSFWSAACCREFAPGAALPSKNVPLLPPFGHKLHLPRGSPLPILPCFLFGLFAPPQFRVSTMCPLNLFGWSPPPLWNWSPAAFQKIRSPCFFGQIQFCRVHCLQKSWHSLVWRILVQFGPRAQSSYWSPAASIPLSHSSLTFLWPLQPKIQFPQHPSQFLLHSIQLLPLLLSAIANIVPFGPMRRFSIQFVPPASSPPQHFLLRP
jgi:hypothetical protein